MARIFSSGFENNDVNNLEWSGPISGAPSISSTTVRSGSYALEITSLTSGQAKGLRLQYLASETTSDMYFRFYFRVDTLPSAENRIVIWNDATGSATPGVYVTLDNSGVLRLYDEDGQITGTTTLSTSTWYRVEVHIDTTAAAGSQTVEMQVDGSSIASDSTRSISATNTPFHFFVGGNINGEAQTTGDWFFDDVAINDNSGSFQNSWPGAGSIIHLRPNAAGDNTDWTPVSGSNYTNVDDITASGDFVYSNTSGQIDDYEIDNTPAAVSSGATINVVQVGSVFSVSNATNPDPDFVLRIKSASAGTVFL